MYTNTAIANSSETDAVSSSVDSQFVPDPDVLITKTVTTSGTYKVGDNIGFNLKADNLGNNTLENVILTDSNATLTCTIPPGFL